MKHHFLLSAFIELLFGILSMFPLAIGHACQMLVIWRAMPSENTFHPIAIKVYSQYISQVKMKWRPPNMKYGKRVLLRLFAGKTGNFYADMIKDLWRRKNIYRYLWIPRCGENETWQLILLRRSLLKCHNTFAIREKILKRCTNVLKVK